MMEYVPAVEAGEKWNITVRRIQQLCSESRIPGAIKLGRTWLIPANSAKPDDPRRARRTGMVFLPYTSITAVQNFLPGKTEAVYDSLTDSAQRIQFECELAYLRGDFALAKSCIAQSSPDSPTWLCALIIGSAAAISDGDYALLRYAQEQFELLRQRYCANPETAALIELGQAEITVSIFDTHGLPDWLMRGDFSRLNAAVRPMALYVYAKYLIRKSMYERMLGAAQAPRRFAIPKTTPPWTYTLP